MSLLDKASLIQIPSGYKATKLYSVVPDSGAGDFTFARSSTGSRVGSDGLIETGVAIDTPRLDYSGGASCPTLLLEPQRTNQQTHSEDLTNPFWATSNVSVVANQTTSPDGNQTADKVDYGAGSGFIRNLVTITSPATTFSIFIKYFDFQFIQIMTSGDVNHYANFDVQNGVLGNVGSSTEAEIEDYGNGWYRIVAKFVSGTFAGQPRLYKITSDTSGWASGGGDAGSFYMWGGQQEVAAFQTSYIPTTSSTVTRSADVCNNAGTSATFNDSEGVLFAEIAALADDGTNRTISISDGTNTNQIVMRYSSTANQVTAYITDGGVITAQFNYTLIDALNYNKIALKYKVNDVALWVNGSEVATDTNATMPSGFDELKFSRADGANDFYGKTKQLMVFNEALSDSELQALTTI